MYGQEEEDEDADNNTQQQETLKMTAIPIPPHYYSCMSRTASSHHGRDNKNRPHTII